MKKMKFRKLSRVLISISLLAIIAVSLISVPASAEDGEFDDLIGTWYISSYSAQPYGNSVREPNISGTFKYLYNGEFVDVDIDSMSLRRDSDNVEYGWLTVNGYYNDFLVSVHYRDNFTQYFSGSTSIASINDSNSMFDDTRYITITGILENDNINDLYALRQFLTDFGIKQIPPSPTLLENILGTFSEVGSWIGTIISSLVALFWSVETASLTFLGILSVAGLAFSTIMLLFGIVTRFVGFSG